MYSLQNLSETIFQGGQSDGNCAEALGSDLNSHENLQSQLSAHR